MAPLALQPQANPTALHLVARLDDDAFEQVLWLSKGLVAAGWDVIVCGPSDDRERELYAAGIGFVRLPLASRNPLTKRLNVRRLLRLIRKYGIRLIHGHALDLTWSAAAAARRSDKPLILSIHDGDQLRRPDPRLSRAMLSAPTERLIVGWEDTAERLCADNPIDATKIRVIHPGIPMENYVPREVRGHRLAALSERWRLDLDKRTVLVPAPISKSQALNVLLEAIHRSERRDYAALLVGELTHDKARLRDIEQQILSFNIGDRVVFGGHCEDMPAAVMLADLVVLPATGSEAVMHLAAQAQAAGKPVVASDVGALPETIMAASTGWLVPAGDAGELARSIDLALTMPPEVVARVAERARTFAADAFSIEQMVRRTLALYREVAADTQRRQSADRRAPLAGAA